MNKCAANVTHLPNTLTLSPQQAFGDWTHHSTTEFEERMRELAVSTQTTPVDLANLFDGLLPDDAVGGRPGTDGAIILYVNSARRCAQHPASVRSVIAARVAIDVVLQQVDGMPGAQPLVNDIRKQLAGDAAATAGWLAPPLALLARLYSRTTSAMPGSPRQIRVQDSASCADIDTDAAEQATFTPQQQQALEALIDRLMALPRRSKQPDRL
jgi:hypothetical protein